MSSSAKITQSGVAAVKNAHIAMVAALMTPLMPGAGPPPTRIASFPLLLRFAISFFG